MNRSRDAVVKSRNSSWWAPSFLTLAVSVVTPKTLLADDLVSSLGPPPIRSADHEPQPQHGAGIAGDADGDGDIDLLDFADYVSCLSESGGNLSAGCTTFDFDGDLDVDFGAFQTAFTGQPASTAQYRVVFNATWSAATHPMSFPAGAHFSPLIGGTHDPTITFWQIGGIASEGIERMAELGSTGVLAQEVNGQVAAGHAGVVILGPGVFPTPGSASATFTATLAFSRATVVTMIAPSPDWFVGVSGLALLVNGRWIDEIVIPLAPFDSGTDSGASYTSPDIDTVPQIPIAEIQGPPLSPGGPAASLGTFRFERIN